MRPWRAPRSEASPLPRRLNGKSGESGKPFRPNSRQVSHRAVASNFGMCCDVKLSLGMSNRLEHHREHRPCRNRARSGDGGQAGAESQLTRSSASQGLPAFSSTTWPYSWSSTRTMRLPRRSSGSRKVARRDRRRIPAEHLSGCSHREIRLRAWFELKTAPVGTQEKTGAAAPWATKTGT